MPAATIFAPATGPGRNALGVIRVSGPEAAGVAIAVAGSLPPPRVASLRTLRDPRDGQEIDRAILLWFPAPRSATGEDVLEIQCHGGAAVREWLLEALASLEGCRLAEPGEFARRAFHADKLDLTAVEGLADLIDAQTRAQARQALRQLEGGLGLMLRQWRSRLLSALARLEAEIDFGDEGAEVPAAELDEEIALLAAEMAKLLADRRGERLRDGLVVAVTGPPNVGKSSLVNALARREVALVSEHPGTTRDVIEVQLEIAGVPVTLLDTAGLRDATDPVEAMGVARARARMVSADLILRLFALGTDAPPDEPGARQVATKLDLAPHVPIPPPMIAVSAVTGEGLPEFLTAIAAEVTVLAGLAGEAMLTRARHREAVAAALRALQGFCRLQASEVALRAEELRVAAQAIARVTGAIGVEDILDEIFARFCLGK
ncbi:MAG: tRNA uridine-5-carboxymethylaminomethyl(34) synthesis GTPase MnmE [Geminicoccaceae bacterium]